MTDPLFTHLYGDARDAADVACAQGRVMDEQATVVAMARLHGADDPWAELALWLRERSAINRSLGGDDAMLISLIVVWVAQLTLPIQRGGR